MPCVLDEGLPVIPGLRLIPDYISAQEETTLLSVIDQQPWLTDLQRRTQHYGYKYDYKSRGIDRGRYLGALPGWLLPLCDRLRDEGIFETLPDQVIVNEYLPGQGIAAHVDCVDCFGPVIGSLSLGAAWVMEFSRKSVSSGGKIPVLLEQRSLLVLSGDARYLWKHGISARKHDGHKGVRFLRQRRVSLTFRKVV